MALRNANAEPRAMTPSATSVSGMYSVEEMAANSGGNAVHISTSTKISQTWLASQTGPMECSIRAPARRARRAPPGQQVPDPGPEVGPAEQGVGGHRRPHDGQDGQRHGYLSIRTLRRPCARATSDSCGAIGTGRLRASRRSTYTVATVSTA